MPRASTSPAEKPPQTPEEIASAVARFLQEHAGSAVLEDGKVLFDMRAAQHALNTEHGRCSLHLWSDERNVVRRVVAATERAGTLRLATLRLGQSQTKLLEIVADRERRTPTARDAMRTRYLRTLERVLAREFPEWKPDGFRTAMDLERSFGPAYARGSLLRGAGNNKDAWAVIGVGAEESQAMIDGVLTLGILWLHTCREQAAGRRLYKGLRVIAPRGAADLTLSRMAWLNENAAQWELWELDERSEELHQRDPGDHGNLRTRLVHHLDEGAAAERFRDAIAQVMTLVPEADHGRVEQKLRSASEMAFSVHGLTFAQARIGLAPNSFARTLEISVGAGAEETSLHEGNREKLAALVAELFERRQARRSTASVSRASQGLSRRIGPDRGVAAHARVQARAERRSDEYLNAAQDPLFRAAPERWLESMLRADLAPLTRGLGPTPTARGLTSLRQAVGYADDPDPDTIGNRADKPVETTSFGAEEATSRVIPRLDPRHIYTQVPAIAGASDRGMLDLLGVTADGRLAVIELKANDDLHLALQGLDYWIRVRHHHLQTADVKTGLGELQRHGYFTNVQLSPLPPRLYLVAPALHIHPATETVLRYFSPRVEWALLALDERWREEVRVVWRKSGGKG